MPFDSLAVANQIVDWFAERGRSITPMKLQKLVFYAHGWYLGYLGKPLIDEQVEAWTFGPVIPSLYSAFAKYGSSAIDEVGSRWVNEGGFKYTNITPKLDDSADSSLARFVINLVNEEYGRRSGIELSNMTHEPNTPWSRVVSRFKDESGKITIPRGTDIPEEIIKEHFAAFFRKNSDENEKPKRPE